MRSTALLALVLFSSSLGAQGVPALTKPLDAAQSIDARDAGFESWRRSTLARAAVPPRVINQGEHRIVIESALARASSRDPGAIGSALTSCADSIRLTPEARTRVLESRPFRAMEAGFAEQPRIAITILPKLRSSIDCARDDALRLMLLTSGVFISEDTTSNAAADLAGVRVIVGGQLITSATQAKEPALTVYREGVKTVDARNAFRLLLRFDDLVNAQATALDRSLTLELVDANGKITPVVVPGDVVIAMRDELLAWRVQRLATGATASSALPISLPQPQDPQLRSARSAYQSGAYVDATGRVLQRLNSARLSEDDVTTATMQAGVTFSAFGDAAAARLMFQQALRNEPCLQLPPTASAETRSQIDAVRERRQCEAIPTLKIVQRSLIPGRFERQLYPTRRLNPLYSIALGTTAALSVATHLQARSAYDDYLQAVSDSDIRSRYDAAGTARLLSSASGIAFWGLYAAPIVRSILAERRFARELDGIRNYGQPSVPRLSMIVTPVGVGVSIPLF